MAIDHHHAPRRGQLVRRGLRLALLLTVASCLQGCLWFHFGSHALTPGAQSRYGGSSEAVDVERTPASRRMRLPERQRQLDNAGPAVRFVGAGALVAPTEK